MVRYNTRIVLLDENNQPLKLRKKMLTTVVFKYRDVYSEEVYNYIEIYDFWIDENNDCLWVRVPEGKWAWFVTLNIGPLRTVQTTVQIDTFNGGTKEVRVHPVTIPLNSLQGYSPFVSKDDGYWYEYSDLEQAYVNTGVKAVDTIGSEFPIVDYIQSGVMSAVTSNAVSELEEGLNNSITNINNRLDDVKEYSVTLNGNNYVADDEGVIDLGEVIAVEAYNDSTTRMTTDNEVINDKIVPRGSLIKTTNYPNTTAETVIALSSPHNFYETGRMSDQWYYLCSLNRGVKMDITVTVYNNSYFGTVEIYRSGYNYKAVATSKDVAQHIKLYQQGLTTYLVAKGSAGVYYGISIEANNTINWLNKPVTNIDMDNISEISVFLTAESKDWINIDESPYETAASDLLVSNFNVAVTECEFNFADILSNPVSLSFNAMQSGTQVTVKDSTDEWTATCRELNIGEVAVLNWSDKDHFDWSYTYQTEYEVTSNKIQAVSSAHTAIEKAKNYVSEACLENYVATHGGAADALTSTTLSSVECTTNGDSSLITTDFAFGYKGLSSVSHIIIRYDGNDNFKGLEIAGIDVPFDDFAKGIKQWGTYYNPNPIGTDIGYITMPDLYVRVNGVDKEFSSTTLYKRVADLGNINIGNELIYNATFVMQEPEYPMMCIVDADTIVELYYQGQKTVVSKNGTAYPWLEEEGANNNLNIWTSSAQTTSFYFNGVSANTEIKVRVLQGRAQIGYVDGTTAKTTVLTPVTNNAVYNKPATYSLSNTATLVAGRSGVDGSAAITDPTQVPEDVVAKNKYITINLSSSNYNIYLPRTYVKKGKIERIFKLNSTTTSKITAKLRNFDGNDISPEISISDAGNRIVKCTFDAELNTWYIS